MQGTTSVVIRLCGGPGHPISSLLGKSNLAHEGLHRCAQDRKPHHRPPPWLPGGQRVLLES